MTSRTFNEHRAHCLACGGELASILRNLGSLRCHDCRDAHEPLRPEPVERWPRPTLVLLAGGASGSGTIEQIAA